MFAEMLLANLPTYVIVELLIRLEPFNHKIGHYRNHSIFGEGVIVRTSGGTIEFSKSLVMDQFNSPESISDQTLASTAQAFNALS